LESDVIPEEFRPQIESGGQKSLIYVANLLEKGYELDHKDWLRFSEKIDDEREVGKISREVQGIAPRSNWQSITINENGVVFEHTVRGSREIGRFEVFDDDPDVQKAIATLKACGGIKETVRY
jgi:hypothetical protein